MDVSGVALITGGASGLGSACARKFALEGATGIAIVDLNLDAAREVKLEAEKIAAAPNFRAEAWKLDVSNETDVECVLNDVQRTFGRVDYVVNSAGIVIIHEGGTATAETRDWQKVMRINLDGTFFVARAAARIMLAQEPRGEADSGGRTARGSIVNVSSIAGVVGVGQSTAYASSKHAVVGLSKTMSEDYAHEGIRVNVVCPGYIETPMTQNDAAVKKEVEERVARTTPMRRLGTADEVADAVLFLAGGRSSYITGVVLMVDGGYTQR